MALNTYPYSPFPASTEQLHKGDNEDLQAQIDAIKDGTNIDSFGDVETALEDKTDTAVIAPDFDAEAGVYAVGDLVMYQGKLYEFTTAHETAGDWDSTEVTEKTVADEIDTVKSGLTNIKTTSTPTGSTAGFRIQTANKTVTIQLDKTMTNSDAAGWVNAGTISGDYTPNYTVYGVIMNNAAAGTTIEPLLARVIENNGSTDIDVYIAANTTVIARGCITYLCK